MTQLDLLFIFWAVACHPSGTQRQPKRGYRALKPAPGGIPKIAAPTELLCMNPYLPWESQTVPCHPPILIMDFNYDGFTGVICVRNSGRNIMDVQASWWNSTFDSKPFQPAKNTKKIQQVLHCYMSEKCIKSQVRDKVVSALESWTEVSHHGRREMSRETCGSQIFLIFTPNLGKIPILTHICSDGLVETTKQFWNYTHQTWIFWRWSFFKW